MPDVRYVCLSDMHLGSDDSLLTNLATPSPAPAPLRPSPVMVQLVECIRFLIGKNVDRSEKPTLVLNGDIFEMALATDNLAAMVFERFIELVMPDGNELFGKIVYIPGNHDHHLWESARETQYANFISELPPGTLLAEPWHTTNIFIQDAPKPIPLFFPTRVVQRYPHLKKRNFIITAAYPNFGLRGDDGKKCVVFSHGHFIESLYLLMSNLMTMIFPSQKMPELPWNVEAQNFAWIDFFWSAMGRSGDAGKDVEIIYEKMQDQEQLKKLLYNLVDGLAKKYGAGGWSAKAKAAIVKSAVWLVVDRTMGTEKIRANTLLSADAQDGLQWFMNVPLRQQIDTECKNKPPAPVDITFVFGHTHKPFAQDMSFTKYPGRVTVYNTGGWVVESDKPQPLHGASIALIDENLNTATIRMYNESAGAAAYAVGVEQVTHAADGPNPLVARLETLVNPFANPWKSFSSIAAIDVRKRKENMHASIVKNV